MIKAVFSNGYELVIEEIYEEYFQKNLRIIPLNDDADLEALVAGVSDGMSEIRVYEDEEYLVTFAGYTEIFDVTRSVTTQSIDQKAHVAIMIAARQPQEEVAE